MTDKPDLSELLKEALGEIDWLGGFGDVVDFTEASHGNPGRIILTGEHKPTKGTVELVLEAKTIAWYPDEREYCDKCGVDVSMAASYSIDGTLCSRCEQESDAS